MVNVLTSEKKLWNPNSFYFICGELVHNLKGNQTYFDETEVFHPQKDILGKYSVCVVPKQLE